MKRILEFLTKLLVVSETNDSNTVDNIFKKIGIILLLILCIVVASKTSQENDYFPIVLGGCFIGGLVCLLLLCIPTKADNNASQINAKKIVQGLDNLNEKANGFLEKEHYNEAGDLFRQVTKVNTNCPEAWEGLGICFEKKGHSKEAKQSFSKSLEIIRAKLTLCVGNSKSSEGFMKLSASKKRLAKKISEMQSEEGNN